jgi:hypothetical protein
MAAGSDLPEVLPSAPDAEYECVLADPEAARAPTPGDAGEGLCPPGYVPRLKRRATYGLRGKEAVVETPPERNPERRPERGPAQDPEHDPERGTGDARS